MIKNSCENFCPEYNEQSTPESRAFSQSLAGILEVVKAAKSDLLEAKRVAMIDEFKLTSKKSVDMALALGSAHAKIDRSIDMLKNTSTYYTSVIKDMSSENYNRQKVFAFGEIEVPEEAGTPQEVERLRMELFKTKITLTRHFGNLEDEQRLVDEFIAHII